MTSTGKPSPVAVRVVWRASHRYEITTKFTVFSVSFVFDNKKHPCAERPPLVGPEHSLSATRAKWSVLCCDFVTSVPISPGFTSDDFVMFSQRGQAAVEWIGVILVASVVLAGLTAAAATVDGRSFGGFLAHRLTCAVRGGCDDGDAALAHAYGTRDAALVRRHLPSFVFEPGERQLPVDWRRCRDVECASTSDDPDLDAHRTDAGMRATVFTRLQRRHGRRYVQYWTYYPDSNTAFAGSDRLWGLARRLGHFGGKLPNGLPPYPGFHRDDWEAVALRVDEAGRSATRVTSHGHWRSCKSSACEGVWGEPTGWARVSKGSHAGHVPPRRARERTATAEGIRLVPLEGIDRRSYRRLDPDIAPPWQKDAYENPESPES